jgi:hypothetical protein
MAYTHFPGVLLKPLGHLSEISLSAIPGVAPQLQSTSPSLGAQRREQTLGPFAASVLRALGHFCAPIVKLRSNKVGGEGGIRTLDALARITVFETVQFNRSCTSPAFGKSHTRNRLAIEARRLQHNGFARRIPAPRPAGRRWPRSLRKGNRANKLRVTLSRRCRDKRRTRR